MRNEDIQETIVQNSAQRVLDALPAAKKAIEGAIARLDAPWYVRAWHQWKGDDGWGNGEELYLFVYGPIAILVLSVILYFMAHK